MFLTEIWNSNEIYLIISFLFFSLFIFLLLGRIVQKKLHIFQNNLSLSVPLGFISYFLITFLVYEVFIIINFELNIIRWVEIIKNSFILLLIIFFYKEWLPKKDEITKKGICSFFFQTLSFVTLFVIFLVFSNFFEWFNYIDTTDNHFKELERLINNPGSSFLFTPYTSNEKVLNALTSNQVYYYWTGVISTISKIELINIFKYIYPFFASLILYFSFFSIFKKDNIKIFPYFYTYISVFLVLITLGWITSSLNGLFFIISLFIIILNLFYFDSLNYETLNNNFFIILIATFILFIFHEVSLILIFAIFFLTVFYCTKREGPIASTIFLSLTFYLFIIGFFLLGLFTWFPILFLFVLLFSLGVILFLYFNVKSSKIILFEENVKKNITFFTKFLVLSFFIIVISFSLFLYEKMGATLIDIFTNMYLQIPNSNLNFLLSSTIYPLLLGTTVFFFAIFYWKKKDNSYFLNSFFILFLLFLNPISISAWEIIFNLKVDYIILVVPFLAVAPIFLYNSILKTNKV